MTQVGNEPVILCITATANLVRPKCRVRTTGVLKIGSASMRCHLAEG